MPRRNLDRRLWPASREIVLLMPSVFPARTGRLARWRRLAGFTLIELMVVLVIIGVLAALIVPNVLDRADDARVTAARTDVSNLMQALKMYRLDNQRYPTAEQGLRALVAKPATNPVPPTGGPIWTSCPRTPGISPISTSIRGCTGKWTCCPLVPTARPVVKAGIRTSAAGNKRGDGADAKALT